MTSREAEALRTETVLRLLNVLLPPASYYRWQDGTEAISGVFLESSNKIAADSFRSRWREDGVRVQVHRRVIVLVEVEETEVELTGG